MITDLISALRAEQLEGANHAREIAERLDAQIDYLQLQMNDLQRQMADLATIKAWVLDSASVRAEAFDALIGPGTGLIQHSKPPFAAVPAMPPVIEEEENAS